ncbi:MAG TPA: anthranilate 1,2-dioxygenase ferredoxin subunit AndAb [Pseudoduganella sp.]|jgi:nitrite reductase/ring-hydroxylating ferredoxin subunit
MTTWHDVGSATDFNEDEPRAVLAGGERVAVFRLGEELYALHDLCTHERVPLSEGFIEDGCIECPLHQGLFDIRTGQPRKAPCTVPVRTYPIRIVDGRVEVDMAGAEALA